MNENTENTVVFSIRVSQKISDWLQIQLNVIERKHGYRISRNKLISSLLEREMNK